MLAMILAFVSEGKMMAIAFRPINPSYCRVVTICGLLFLSACQTSPPVEPRNLNIQQNWALKPGEFVAGYRISGGLGDISIEVDGSTLFAPFSGVLQPHQTDCAIFSSPEVPAYLLRMCGIQKPQLGPIQSGTRIGTGDTVHFAALRKQPTGQWAIVEPASDILERILSQPSP